MDTKSYFHVSGSTAAVAATPAPFKKLLRGTSSAIVASLKLCSTLGGNIAGILRDTYRAGNAAGACYGAGAGAAKPGLT